MPFTWIITKSQPHADAQVIELRRQGFCAHAMPCIEHRWLGWPELARLAAERPALLFVTSRATAARIEPPAGALVAALAPATSATLTARGIEVAITVQGGVRELADAVVAAARLPADLAVFYPTSDAALHQPEHAAAVAALRTRFEVHVQAVYDTVAPEDLPQEIAALRAAGATPPPPGYAFWSPSAIDHFAAAQGFGLQPGPVVLVGGSTERRWREVAPSGWQRASRHDAETPLEWSLRLLERAAAPGS